ncbi:hypothetical protein KUV41_11650 [Halomonas sp. DP8Y7-1]|uniref:hypothetical protein n=1 Tax=unclassified Halomonas TaxID=2609666 RepID=UPI001C950983|nr:MULTISPECIES: hypothetical protein [unclassified Halomonas]MBY5984422.1 hypothetical protein [Halomonas sp. DP5Y7-2]MBY6030012.1 hypothetical protein [Halomonas sp. DP8Y7-1]
MNNGTNYHHTINQLHDALDHIARMARASRTQTKRLRRIAMRAEKARNGETFCQEEACSLKMKVRSPASYEAEIRVLRREITELKGVATEPTGEVK